MLNSIEIGRNALLVCLQNQTKKEDDKIENTTWYTKEEFYEEIRRLYNQYGNVDVHIFNKYAVRKANFRWYCHKFGGIKKILSELGLEFKTYNQIDKDTCIQKGRDLLKKYGYISKNLCASNGVSSCVIERIFGNFQNYYKELGYENNFHRNVTWEDLKEDILKYIDKSHSLSCRDYRKNGNYSQGVIDRFGGWCKIMKELGYEPIAEKVGKEEIIERLQSLIDKYGYLSKSLVDEKCTFTFQAVEYWFGDIKNISNYFQCEDLFKYGTSSKEKEISKILDELLGRDNYETQKTWNWLRSDTGKNLKVDFYIPSMSIAIEYDGQQHYNYIEYFHKTTENFKRSQALDKIKDTELEKHNIKLVRIPYTQEITEELIESIIA